MRFISNLIQNKSLRKNADWFSDAQFHNVEFSRSALGPHGSEPRRYGFKFYVWDECKKELESVQWDSSDLGSRSFSGHPKGGMKTPANLGVAFVQSTKPNRIVA
jgi:hypothetical protein